MFFQICRDTYKTDKNNTYINITYEERNTVYYYALILQKQLQQHFKNITKYIKKISYISMFDENSDNMPPSLFI